MSAATSRSSAIRNPCQSLRWPLPGLKLVTTQLHSLEGVTETYIVIAGTGQLEVGSETMEIGAGDQVVIPAGTPQRVTATSDVDLRFYCLCTPRFLPGAYINLEA